MSDDIFGDVIDAYTRAQAIEDGSLIDVSSVAKEAGIKWPVALTRAVWDRYIEVPPGVDCQDEKGRLWDVLWLLRLAIRRSRGGTELSYVVLVRNDNDKPETVELKAVSGPGDDGEPTITVMLPEED